MLDPQEELNQINSEIAEGFKSMDLLTRQKMILEGTIDGLHGKLRNLLLKRDACLNRVRKYEGLKQTFNHEES